MTAGPAHGYAAGYDAGMHSYLDSHTVDRCAPFFTAYLRPGMSLLDAGCGPGTITVGLAPLIAPGRLAAVDVSAGEVATTKRRLESAGYGSADVVVADIRDLPFERDSFDAVFSHAVLDYLPDPERALAEFRRVLKPGGVVGVRSQNSGYAVISPPDEAVEESLNLFRRAIAAQGGDAYRGKMVGQMLKEGGFERIFTRSSNETPDSREDWPGFCQAIGAACGTGRIAEMALRNGWADEARLAEIVEAWERFGSDSANLLALSWGEAVGFKP